MFNMETLGRFAAALGLGAPTHESRPQSQSPRQTQAEAIKQYVTKGETFPKFCGHCGSLIEQREIRQWHVDNEHPGKAPSDMRFCLFCGDEFEGAKIRLDHYDTHRPKVQG